MVKKIFFKKLKAPFSSFYGILFLALNSDPDLHPSKAGSNLGPDPQFYFKFEHIWLKSVFLYRYIMVFFVFVAEKPKPQKTAVLIRQPVAVPQPGLAASRPLFASQKNHQQPLQPAALQQQRPVLSFQSQPAPPARPLLSAEASVVPKAKSAPVHRPAMIAKQPKVGELRRGVAVPAAAKPIMNPAISQLGSQASEQQQQQGQPERRRTSIHNTEVGSRQTRVNRFWRKK
jgi:hypothetical protein